MPVVDFTNPFYLVSALALFLLCEFLSRNSKTNTVACIVLLAFLSILVGHTIELAYAGTSEALFTLTKCIVVDEAFVLVSFLSFLWADRIQIDNRSKAKKSKDTKAEDKTFKDGLDFLWKKV